MKSQTRPRRATHYPTTHPGVMTVSLLLLSVLLDYLLHTYNDGSIEPWQTCFVCSLLWIVAGFYGIKWTRTIYLTSDGITFYRFRKVYRQIRWEDIIQIGIAKEYKASKLTIVITPRTCPQFDSSYPSPTIYVERNRKHLILLDATNENIESIQTVYGKMDYHTNHILFDRSSS